MAFSFENSKKVMYYLHKNERQLASGKVVNLYYFSKSVNDEKSVDAIPEGYVVSESKNGLPVLKKSG